MEKQDIEDEFGEFEDAFCEKNKQDINTNLENNENLDTDKLDLDDIIIKSEENKVK